MKSKPFLLAACVLWVLLLASRPALAAEAVATNRIAAAEQFITLLAGGDFAGATNRFDGAMMQALPESKLRDAWKSLEQQGGPFRKTLPSRELRLGNYDGVLVGCQFERLALDAKVVFNRQGQISGLFFVPAQTTPAAASPAPYVQTNSFQEKAFEVGRGSWRLPGTLSLPVGASKDSRVPAVVLVHGSGPNDRDETVGANKPFRDLAWGLASKGIAVLRYEKRTKEHAKRLGGNIPGFTVQEETLEDALQGASQLRRTEGIDPGRVFILGHSLGGLVAPRLALEDPRLAGLIILAGPTRPPEDLILEQTRYLVSLAPSEAANAQLSQIVSNVTKIKELTAADFSSPKEVMGAPASYWLDLRQHDPVAAAQTLKMPLLILQGGRDYQVTTEDFARWKTGLATRTNCTLKLYPRLNHLFIAGQGQSTPGEYEVPGHVDPAVVTDIAEWVNRQR